MFAQFTLTDQKSCYGSCRHSQYIIINNATVQMFLHCTLYNKMASSIFPFKNSIIVNVFYNFFEGLNNLNFEF